VRLRFRKSVRLGRGLHLNFGKPGLTSLSVGNKWAGVSVGRHGATARAGLPGTGLSYVLVGGLGTALRKAVASLVTRPRGHS
jgi:hypothetical protein